LNSRPAPFFLMGITRRSGTSYLYHLLELHPDCSVGQISEDFLLSHADLLVEYAEKTPELWWKHVQEGDNKYRKMLLKSIGDGLISFLWATAENPDKKRLLAKSPSVKNIDCFFELFPEAKLLILIRDGRDVAESHVRTAGGTYENAIQEWAKGARSIMNFDKQFRNLQGQYLFVKYENVFANTRNELIRIFNFLGLSSAAYDFDKAEHLPVYGSSEFRGSRKEVHWNPVAKTPDFKPVLRWHNWPQSRRDRFRWIAEKYLDFFGYEKVRPGQRFGGLNLKNRVLDMVWDLRNLRRR